SGPVRGHPAPYPIPGVPAAPGALPGSDLDVDPGDAQPHAAGPARRWTTAAATRGDGGDPVRAGQPPGPGPAVGASLRGALIGHGPDHTGAAVSPPALRAGTPARPLEPDAPEARAGTPYTPAQMADAPHAVILAAAQGTRIG